MVKANENFGINEYRIGKTRISKKYRKSFVFEYIVTILLTMSTFGNS